MHIVVKKFDHCISINLNFFDKLTIKNNNNCIFDYFAFISILKIKKKLYGLEYCIILTSNKTNNNKQ